MNKNKHSVSQKASEFNNAQEKKQWSKPQLESLRVANTQAKKIPDQDGQTDYHDS